MALPNSEEENRQVEVSAARPLVPKTETKPRQNITIGTLNIYNRLPQSLQKPLAGRYEKFYQKNQAHFWLDLLGALIVLALIAFNLIILLQKDIDFSVGLGNFELVNIKNNSGQESYSTALGQQLISPDKAVINPKGDLYFKIIYKNESQSALKNLQLKTQLLADGIQYKISKGDLNATIESLAAGQTWENEVRLTGLTAESNLINLKSSLTFLLNSGQKKVDSETIYLKVNSELNFLAYAKYFSAEGDQLGRGPLPPEVGDDTTYWIFFQLGPSGFNDLASLEVSARLAENASFTGKSSVSSGEALKYDQAGHKIVWKLDSLLKDQKVANASFEVKFIPAENQVNTSPLLLRDLTAQAIDVFTGSIIKAQAPNITTDLLYDDFAKGKNLVIE